MRAAGRLRLRCVAQVLTVVLDDAELEPLSLPAVPGALAVAGRATLITGPALQPPAAPAGW